MSGLIASALAAHIPRIGIEERAPEFARPMITGLRETGDWLRDLEPDVVVIQGTHWVCSFNWYVTAQPIHEGVCVADEAPDLIPGLPYRYQGDPELAARLVDRISDAGIPCILNDSPHYRWDYATYVPMKYLDPKAQLTVLALPTVLAASHDECRQVGRAVHTAARDLGRRVVFVASSALTHDILRGPERWPTEERQALDGRFTDLLERGALDEAVAWFPEYSRAVVAEMGGRVLAGLLGSLEVFGNGGFRGRRYGTYAQSSGSGNLCMSFTPT